MLARLNNDYNTNDYIRVNITNNQGVLPMILYIAELSQLLMMRMLSLRLD